ncbi:hypothetical protein J2X32_000981 [Rheinheimera pacifica]|nr:hypothetical protein [Rheinheimera pacifica]
MLASKDQIKAEKIYWGHKKLAIELLLSEVLP